MAATDPQTAELPEPGDRVRVTGIGPHKGCEGILLTRGPFAHAILLDKDARLGSGGTRFFRPVELDWLRLDDAAAEGMPADLQTAADEHMQARLDYIDSRTGAVHTMALLEAELARAKAELEQAKRGVVVPVLRQAWRNGWTDRGNAMRDNARTSNGERDVYERAFARYMSEDPAEADKDPHRPLDGPDDPAAVPTHPADGPESTSNAEVAQ